MGKKQECNMKKERREISATESSLCLVSVPVISGAEPQSPAGREDEEDQYADGANLWVYVDKATEISFFFYASSSSPSAQMSVGPEGQ
jgi:hypothetical protein